MYDKVCPGELPDFGLCLQSELYCLLLTKHSGEYRGRLGASFGGSGQVDKGAADSLSLCRSGRNKGGQRGLGSEEGSKALSVKAPGFGDTTV